MSYADANKVDIYFSQETVWDETPSSPAMTQMRFTGESLDYKKSTAVSDTIRSDRMRDSVAPVGYGVEGDINFELSCGSFDDIWEAAFSKDVKSIPGAGISGTWATPAKTLTRAAGSWITDGYLAGMWVKISGFTTPGNNGFFEITAVTSATVLTFGNATGLSNEGPVTIAVKVNNFRNGTTAKSLLLEKRFTDISQFISYQGCRVGGFSIDMKAMEKITGSFSFMGAKAILAGSKVGGTDTPASTNPILTASANVGNILVNDTAVSVGVKSLSIKCANNLRAQDQIGSAYAAGIGYGFMEITGSMEVYFEDATFYNFLLNHTALKLSVRATDGSGNVMIFTIPNFYIVGGSPKAAGGNQDVMLPFDFVAVRDANMNCIFQIDSL